MPALRTYLKVATLMAFIVPLSVHATTIAFDFEQSGFDEGAKVTGMFWGDDLNGDGQLSSFDGEILDFMMSFSGNALVGAFGLGFVDLFGLVYDLDGGDLGDGISLDIEGIGADGALFSYVAGPGPFGLCGIGADCAQVLDKSTGAADFSGELVSVSVKVPEPGTLALLGMGLLGMGFARRINKV